MSWFTRDKAGIEKKASQNVKVPEGMWTKCPSCSETVLTQDIVENLQVCTKCGHHFRIAPRARLAALLDGASWQEFDADITSVDFLAFKDTKS